ncbi:hypothetical protein PO124_17510 [Bacillus licheniformis]|nr:hypothetical protein [Bacillus licheniformis]
MAKRQSITNPNTIMSIKRHMGTDYTVEIEGKSTRRKKCLPSSFSI